MDSVRSDLPRPPDPGATAPAIDRANPLFFTVLVRHLPRNPDGRTMHPSALSRWRDRGILGVRLEAVRVGGRWATSIEAVERFFARVTAARTAATNAPRTTRPTPDTARELDAEGL